MKFEQLKLGNQLCFPVYAASRLIIREYQPYLDKLRITYPQYLVLMVLWENDGITVNDITDKLVLKTNTVTPLLKRMESLGIISRNRSGEDERKVLITLTEKGKKMKLTASSIPGLLVDKLKDGALTMEQLVELRTNLNRLIDYLQNKEESR
jgi:DNA-binding MarR family transcriptional regulator